MKRSALLALLMVLPLSACNTPVQEGNNNVPPPVIDNGGEGEQGGGSQGGGGQGQGEEGGGQGGGGGQQQVEVKQSELLNVLKSIAFTVGLSSDDIGNGSEYWKEDKKAYLADLSFGNDVDTWEKGLNEFKTHLPQGYVVKDARKSATYDEYQCLQENYLIESKIQVDAYSFRNVGTGAADEWIEVDFFIHAAEGTKFVDDVVESERTVTISFLNNGFTGDLTTSAKETFVDWFNTKATCDDLLKDLTVTDGFAEVNSKVREDGKDTTLKLSNGGLKSTTIQFTFDHNISAITFNAQAYYKTWSNYGEGMNVDTASKLIVNGETTPVDLSCESGKVPPIEVITRKFSSPLKTFTIGSTGGRILIDYMTITFKA